ncbi:MAG: sodium:proline symporter [Phycisphaerae bacterium]|jgi:SSS family solute:Na+ symporter
MTNFLAVNVLAIVGMSQLDWLLALIPVVVVAAFALYTRRFVKGVADFMAGGRCAGRYIICNARGEAGSGVANTMGFFQTLMVAGFVMTWWSSLAMPVGVILGVSGFVLYRYRETRALTLAQFFEMRYSRRFRLFMGMLGFLAGVMNYGIFPAVSSRFFVYFLQLPATVEILGFHIQTFILIMLTYQSLTLSMLLIGGQITLLVTDCIEGIISHGIYIVIAIAALAIINWEQISAWLMSAEPNHSMVNPYDAWAVQDFNLWYVVVGMLTGIYGTMAWQNQHGFNAAASSPHEGRMGGILGSWRNFARGLMMVVLAMCAMTFLNQPQFHESSAAARSAISSLNPDFVKEATIPVALGHLMPVGIKGLFLAMMLLGLVAGDAGHTHSWGSIFIQDVVMPLRKNPLTPRQHIWVLRAGLTGVAVFAFFFSIFFTLREYIMMWWVITTAIFVSGAGAAIIGGLYWKKGTTPGAWSAVLVGSTLALAGIITSNQWTKGVRDWLVPWMSSFGWVLPEKFPLNGMYMGAIVCGVAAMVYVIVSLLTCRQDFDMDRMLHRGKYRVEAHKIEDVKALSGRWTLAKILGFDADFSFWDKVICAGLFIWSVFWTLLVIVGTIWNMWQPLMRWLGLGGSILDAVKPWPQEWWVHYWYIVGILLPFFIAAVTFVWFGFGGVVNLAQFFTRLKTLKRDARDDGRVVAHHLASDEPAVTDAPGTQPEACAAPGSLVQGDKAPD